MKRALRLPLIVLFSAFADSRLANATPVEIVSSVFSISGYVEGVDYANWASYSLSYADSRPVPVSGWVNYGGYYNGGYAGSGAGFLGVDARTGGGANGPNFATASADVLFRPLSPMSQLTIDWMGYLPGAAGGAGTGNIELIDLTEGNQIFSQEVDFIPMFGPYSGSYLINGPFLTDRVYELFMSSSTDSGYDWVSLDISTNDLIPAPDGGSTLGLIGLALAGVVALRRKIGLA
jgi:VPDSG-CTERM motif